jgi:hypothetical protein
MVSMRRTTFCCLTVTLLLPAGASSEIYLARSVIGCGGGEGNSSSYNIAYTAGQIAVGRASGPTYLHEIGFWARTAMNPADVESDDSERLPERIDFRLTGANPVENAGSVLFSMPHKETVRIALYDVSGRTVQVLHEGPVDPGYHHVSLDPSQLASGVYYCRMNASSFGKTLRLIVLR